LKRTRNRRPLVLRIGLGGESPTYSVRYAYPESVATLPPFSPIEVEKWFDQISSQWESQKNRFALTYFGKIQFLPPCIWNLPFMSTASGKIGLKQMPVLGGGVFAQPIVTMFYKRRLFVIFILNAALARAHFAKQQRPKGLHCHFLSYRGVLWVFLSMLIMNYNAIPRLKYRII